MREVEIPLTSRSSAAIESAIERAIVDCGLHVTLRATLTKCPGCIHWHIKHGNEPGTLEITFWPPERRAWFTIQEGRKGKWIDERLRAIMRALRQRHGKR